MKNRDIKALAAEYGVNNLRVFITDDLETSHRLNPFAGRKEYVIVEEKDKLVDNYKLQVELTGDDRIEFDENYPAPEWWVKSFNRRRFYISDFDSLSRVEVFVLVDIDNKYVRVG